MSTTKHQRRPVPWLAGIGGVTLAALAVLYAGPAAAAPRSASVTAIAATPRISTPAAAAGLPVPALPTPSVPALPTPSVPALPTPSVPALPTLSVPALPTPPLPPLKASLPPLKASLPPLKASLSVPRLSVPSVSVPATSPITRLTAVRLPTAAAQPDHSQRSGAAPSPSRDALRLPLATVAAKQAYHPGVGTRLAVAVRPASLLIALLNPYGWTGVMPNPSAGAVQLSGVSGDGVLGRRSVGLATRTSAPALLMSRTAVLVAIIAILALTLITAAYARRLVLLSGYRPLTPRGAGP